MAPLSVDVAPYSGPGTLLGPRLQKELGACSSDGVAHPQERQEHN
jgi:hypothetical protein